MSFCLRAFVFTKRLRSKYKHEGTKTKRHEDYFLIFMVYTCLKMCINGSSFGEGLGVRSDVVYPLLLNLSIALQKRLTLFRLHQLEYWNRLLFVGGNFMHPVYFFLDFCIFTNPFPDISVQHFVRKSDIFLVGFSG